MLVHCHLAILWRKKKQAAVRHTAPESHGRRVWGVPPKTPRLKTILTSLPSPKDWQISPCTEVAWKRVKKRREREDGLKQAGCRREVQILAGSTERRVRNHQNPSFLDQDLSLHSC